MLFDKVSMSMGSSGCQEGLESHEHLLNDEEGKIRL